MPGLTVQENVPLAPLSTLGVGGAARFYARATDRDAVAAGMAWAAARGVPLFVLGGGSNVVVADEGYPGLVLHVVIEGIETRLVDGGVLVRAAAGESWDALVASATAHGWGGVECLSGIPGRVGATPIQNVGAYGQDVSETVTAVEAFDIPERKVVSLSNRECGFGYRSSRFKGADRDRYIILGVEYRLVPGGAPAVRYPDLQRHFAERGSAAPTLPEVREAVLEVRRRKSMVLDPADPNARSVGSFFMNPVVSKETCAAVEASALRKGPRGAETMPRWPVSGGVKLSAAWLIERTGFSRGYRRGNAAISENHTLALVNRGGAAAREVVGLAREIRDGVHAAFGVSLVPEPVFLNVSLGDEGSGNWKPRAWARPRHWIPTWPPVLVLWSPTHTMPARNSRPLLVRTRSFSPTPTSRLVVMQPPFLLSFRIAASSSNAARSPSGPPTFTGMWTSTRALRRSVASPPCRPAENIRSTRSLIRSRSSSAMFTNWTPIPIRSCM